MASSDSHINKPQRGRPKRAEKPDVNINTGAQSINTESLQYGPSCIARRVAQIRAVENSKFSEMFRNPFPSFAFISLFTERFRFHVPRVFIYLFI